MLRVTTVGKYVVLTIKNELSMIKKDTLCRVVTNTEPKIVVYEERRIEIVH